jgi:nicotinamidase/pyrazinamidase
MKALLIVDIQNDFMLNGSLPVRGADEVIPIINQLTRYPFDFIIATKDYHPEDHGSFASNHQGKSPGDHVMLLNINQILWSDHCVKNSPGSDFPSTLNILPISHIVYKGTDPLVDSYSAFFDNAQQRATGLEEYLKTRKVKELFILGVATDYCVKYTVLDAISLGFQTYIITDACRGVNIKSSDSDEALFHMKDKGALLITSKEVPSLLDISP